MSLLDNVSRHSVISTIPNSHIDVMMHHNVDLFKIIKSHKTTSFIDIVDNLLYQYQFFVYSIQEIFTLVEKEMIIAINFALKQFNLIGAGNLLDNYILSHSLVNKQQNIIIQDIIFSVKWRMNNLHP